MENVSSINSVAVLERYKHTQSCFKDFFSLAQVALSNFFPAICLFFCHLWTYIKFIPTPIMQICKVYKLMVTNMVDNIVPWYVSDHETGLKGWKYSLFVFHPSQYIYTYIYILFFKYVFCSIIYVICRVRYLQRVVFVVIKSVKFGNIPICLR